jgi:hypothetical protein
LQNARIGAYKRICSILEWPVKGCEGVKGNITENTLIGFENINVTKTPIDVKSLFGVDEWVIIHWHEYRARRQFDALSYNPYNQ